LNILDNLTKPISLYTPGQPHEEIPSSPPKLTNRIKSLSFGDGKQMTPVVSIEIIKEVARYCSETFSVNGTLTLTSELFIFEPSLTDSFVLKNGVLPYQLYVGMEAIFDCQVVKENPNYYYDTTLEISTFSEKDSSVMMYDFILDESKLYSVYKKLMVWISQSNESKKKIEQIPKDNLVEVSKTEAAVNAFHEFAPKLSQPSVVLTSDYLITLQRYLPARLRLIDKWHLLFGTQTHGISLNTFYTRTKDEGPSIIVIKDKGGRIFGGFASDSWRIESRFYGTGESFVFRVNPTTSELQAYTWTQKNVNYMCSRRDFIALGGGTNFGLWMDSDFERGSSSYCETFDNPSLSSTEDFQILLVEVWGFYLPTSTEIVSPSTVRTTRLQSQSIA